MNPLSATACQLQSLAEQGYFDESFSTGLPQEAIATRAWWVYFHPVEQSALWLDLDRWVDYAEARWPELDIEQLDMALGCC